MQQNQNEGNNGDCSPGRVTAVVGLFIQALQKHHIADSNG
nr:MAG TPA: hypothetical protein [Caudoviricetes sp.]